MSSPTKLELTQINAKLATENATLRKQVADLEFICKLKHERTTAAPTPPSTTPQWQQDRLKAMAAARDMAMRTRIAIKV